MLLHQGCEGVGFKCIALVQLVFPPMMQRGLPCCNSGMDTPVFQGPELRHKFSPHERWGRWGLSASPSSQTWASAPGEWGVEVSTNIWCNQGLETPVFQGLKLRHLPHMRDGVAAKRRSGFERAPTRARVFGHLCFYTWAMNLSWFPQSVVEFKFNRE